MAIDEMFQDEIRVQAITLIIATANSLRSIRSALLGAVITPGLISGFGPCLPSFFKTIKCVSDDQMEVPADFQLDRDLSHHPENI